MCMEGSCLSHVLLSSPAQMITLSYLPFEGFLGGSDCLEIRLWQTGSVELGRASVLLLLTSVAVTFLADAVYLKRAREVCT